MSQEGRSSTGVTNQQSRKTNLHHKTFRLSLLSLAIGGLFVAPAWCGVNMASQAAANATAADGGAGESDPCADRRCQSGVAGSHQGALSAKSHRRPQDT